jgi:hypothetical protein
MQPIQCPRPVDHVASVLDVAVEYDSRHHRTALESHHGDDERDRSCFPGRAVTRSPLSAGDFDFKKPLYDSYPGGGEESQLLLNLSLKKR